MCYMRPIVILGEFYGAFHPPGLSVTRLLLYIDLVSILEHLINVQLSVSLRGIYLEFQFTVAAPRVLLIT